MFLVVQRALEFKKFLVTLNNGIDKLYSNIDTKINVPILISKERNCNVFIFDLILTFVMVL